MFICPECGRGFKNSDKCPSCPLPQIIQSIPHFAPELADSRESYQNGRHEKIIVYQDKHFWFRSRNELLLGLLKQKDIRFSNILDVGCGVSSFLSQIRENYPSARIYGTDLFTSPLQYAKSRHPDGIFFQSSIETLPYREEFDLVTCLDVLEHIEDDESAFDKLVEAVVPGGYLLVTVPQHQFLWSDKDLNAHHKRRYSRKAFLAHVHRNDLEVVFQNSFIALLFPALILSRRFFLSRKRSGTQRHNSDFAEFRINNLTNLALYTVCKLENFISLHGIPFRFGGSVISLMKKPLP